MYLIEDGNEFHLESSIIPFGISAIETLFWSLGGWGGCVWASGKMLGAWEQAHVFLEQILESNRLSCATAGGWPSTQLVVAGHPPALLPPLLPLTASQGQAEGQTWRPSWGGGNWAI